MRYRGALRRKDCEYGDKELQEMLDSSNRGSNESPREMVKIDRRRVNARRLWDKWNVEKAMEGWNNQTAGMPLNMENC